MVERWRTEADLPVPAELSECQSLIALHQVDRAWTRLRAIIEGAGAPKQAYLLAGELLAARGWYKEARGVIERGMTAYRGDAALTVLWDSLGDESQVIAISEEEPDLADADLALELVEQWLVAGQEPRARATLDRLAQRHPEHARTQLLLWATEGDYSSSISLGSLVEAASPDLLHLSEAAPEVEWTEAGQRPLPSEQPALADRAMPNLFRSQDAASDEPENTSDPDVTAVTSMAELGPALAPSEARGEDTQIMRVIRKDGEEYPAPKAIHVGASDITSSFDLSAYRRELGIADDFGPAREREDDDVVVVTRKGDGRADQTTQDTDVRGMRLVHESLPTAPARPLVLEREDWARPPSREPSEQATEPPQSATSLAARAPKGPRNASSAALTPDDLETTATPAPARSRPAVLDVQPLTWWILTLVLLCIAAIGAVALVIIAVMVG